MLLMFTNTKNECIFAYIYVKEGKYLTELTGRQYP